MRLAGTDYVASYRLEAGIKDCTTVNSVWDPDCWGDDPSAWPIAPNPLPTPSSGGSGGSGSTSVFPGVSNQSLVIGAGVLLAGVLLVKVVAR